MKLLFLKCAQRLRARFHKEDGAVTVDWVVLTAAIVGVAVAAAASVLDATTTLSTSIGDGLSTKSVSNGD